MKNLVVFKGHVGGITLILDKEAEFELILEQFKEKLKNSKQFFKDVAVNLHVKGRQLTEEEENQLIQVLSDQEIMNVSFIQMVGKQSSEDQAISQKQVEENQKQVENHETEVPQEENEVSQDVRQVQEDNKQDELAQASSPIDVEESETHSVKLQEVFKKMPGGYSTETYFYYGVVRSGQHISYEGSVVILGDVNPGAVVSASDNVIVLGALKGSVYAGQRKENEHPFVIASKMTPTQITLGQFVAQPSEADRKRHMRENDPIQIAYIFKEAIYVEEIDYKTLNHMLK